LAHDWSFVGLSRIVVEILLPFLVISIILDYIGRRLYRASRQMLRTEKEALRERGVVEQ
jgi:hypothetical protein